MKELKRIGKAFKGVPLAVSILEGGGKTPWLPPEEFHEMGFNMLLYPTSILFRLAHSVIEEVENLRKGKPLDKSKSVSMKEFEEIVELNHWKQIEVVLLRKSGHRSLCFIGKKICEFKRSCGRPQLHNRPPIRPIKFFPLALTERAFPRAG